MYQHHGGRRITLKSDMRIQLIINAIFTNWKVKEYDMKLLLLCVQLRTVRKTFMWVKQFLKQFAEL